MWHDADAQTESRESREMQKIGQSIAYMIRHLDVPLRAATLAAEVNLSPSHFFFLFKHYVGSTPIDYFIRLRLRRACQLLENTEMSVKAIAYTLGYEDPFYFSRVFKRINQIAPSRYRSLKLENRKAAAPAVSETVNLSPPGRRADAGKRTDVPAQYFDDRRRGNWAGSDCGPFGRRVGPIGLSTPAKVNTPSI